MGATMYGPAIAQAIARGDLAAMKALAREAARHLKEFGDISASLEALKIEIMKLEASKKTRKKRQ
jgi:hypothetical protein